MNRRLSLTLKTLPIDQQAGFTLIETILTLLLIGVLFAIAAPSYLSWVNKKKVDDALIQVVGALKESQSEALRQGQGCFVMIDSGNRRIWARTIISTSSPPTLGDNCLPTGNREFTASTPNLQINTNFNDLDESDPLSNRLIFTSKKTTPNAGIIVLSLPDASRQRCAVLSAGIGIIRTGYYQGNPTTPVDTNCRRDP